MKKRVREIMRKMRKVKENENKNDEMIRSKNKSEKSDREFNWE